MAWLALVGLESRDFSYPLKAFFYNNANNFSRFKITPNLLYSIYLLYYYLLKKVLAFFKNGLK